MKQKYRFNQDKLLRNIVALTTIVSTIAIVTKIANCGLACLSTIRLFWIGGEVYVSRSIKKSSNISNDNI